MKRKCAVFTMAHREEYFLPLWYKYYSKYFDDADMYVFNHKRKEQHTYNDGTDGLTCNVEVLIEDSLYENYWMIRTLKDKQKGLLEQYEYIIYTDTDEFIIPDPDKYIGIMDYIDYMKENDIDAICCCCYEVVQRLEEEPEDLRWNDPILVDQRKYWINMSTYNKPLIASRPLNWSWGKHFEEVSFGGPSTNIAVDNDLIMVHLYKVDYKAIKKRLENNYKTGICQTKATQYVGKKFDDYFNDPHHDDCTDGVLTLIPEKFRGII